MVDLEKLKSEFWDGKYKVDYENEKGKSKKKPTQFYFDEEGIKIAIKRAIGDFTDRTEKLNPDSGYKSFGVEEKFKVLCGTDGKEYNEPKDGSFVQKFIDYFFKNPVELKSQKDFDDWHKEMCEEFLAVIGPKYQGGLKYGKAQKIVNMTFKNAYCLNNKVNSEFTNCDKYYEYCHMPLDSLTLEWFTRTQIWLKSDWLHLKKNDKFFLKGEMPESWSKMEEDSKADDKFGYETIQNRIRTYLKDYADKNKSTDQLQGYTPLQAEFFVWKNIQLELAAEGVYNKLFDFKVDNEVTKEDFKRKTLEEKLESLKEILNSLNFDEI